MCVRGVAQRSEDNSCAAQRLCRHRQRRAEAGPQLPTATDQRDFMVVMSKNLVAHRPNDQRDLFMTNSITEFCRGDLRRAFSNYSRS